MAYCVERHFKRGKHTWITDMEYGLSDDSMLLSRNNDGNSVVSTIPHNQHAKVAVVVYQAHPSYPDSSNPLRHLNLKWDISCFILWLSSIMSSSGSESTSS